MASSILKNKRVFVAGHKGMVGSALVRRLSSEQPSEVITAHRAECDLRNQAEVSLFFEKTRPEIVFMSAAKVGGIGANSSYPAQFIYDNLMIEANTIESARQVGVEKLVFLGSSCIYPKFANQPIKEDELLAGPLEPTNEWYAIAKIAGIKLCQAYNIEYGTSFISVQPTNLYGRGDNYDLNNSHVLPALIRKIYEAKLSDSAEVEVWGTGQPLREFLFVDDLADALVFVANKYNGNEALNIGSGQEISIKDLALLISEVVGFNGDIRFNTDKPDGTPRKLLDSSKLEVLGWRPRTELREGIIETLKCYKNSLTSP